MAHKSTDNLTMIDDDTNLIEEDGFNWDIGSDDTKLDYIIKDDTKNKKKKTIKPKKEEEEEEEEEYEHKDEDEYEDEDEGEDYDIRTKYPWDSTSDYMHTEYSQKISDWDEVYGLLNDKYEEYSDSLLNPDKPKVNKSVCQSDRQHEIQIFNVEQLLYLCPGDNVDYFIYNIRFFDKTAMKRKHWLPALKKVEHDINKSKYNVCKKIDKGFIKDAIIGRSSNGNHNDIVITIYNRVEKKYEGLICAKYKLKHKTFSGPLTYIDLICSNSNTLNNKIFKNIPEEIAQKFIEVNNNNIKKMSRRFKQIPRIEDNIKDFITDLYKKLKLSFGQYLQYVLFFYLTKNYETHHKFLLSAIESIHKDGYYTGLGYTFRKASGPYFIYDFNGDDETKMTHLFQDTFDKIDKWDKKIKLYKGMFDFYYYNEDEDEEKQKCIPQWDDVRYDLYNYLEKLNKD